MAAELIFYRDYVIERSDAPSWCRDMQWQAYPADYGGEQLLFGSDPNNCREVIDWHLD